MVGDGKTLAVGTEQLTRCAVVVRGLPPGIIDVQLKKYFVYCGEVKGLAMDKERAIVYFRDSLSAAMAMRLDGALLDGSRLSVRAYRARDGGLDSFASDGRLALTSRAFLPPPITTDPPPGYHPPEPLAGQLYVPPPAPGAFADPPPPLSDDATPTASRRVTKTASNKKRATVAGPVRPAPPHTPSLSVPMHSADPLASRLPSNPSSSAATPPSAAASSASSAAGGASASQWPLDPASFASAAELPRALFVLRVPADYGALTAGVLSEFFRFFGELSRVAVYALPALADGSEPVGSASPLAAVAVWETATAAEAALSLDGLLLRGLRLEVMPLQPMHRTLLASFAELPPRSVFPSGSAPAVEVLAPLDGAASTPPALATPNTASVPTFLSAGDARAVLSGELHGHNRGESEENAAASVSAPVLVHPTTERGTGAGVGADRWVDRAGSRAQAAIQAADQALASAPLPNAAKRETSGIGRWFKNIRSGMKNK